VNSSAPVALVTNVTGFCGQPAAEALAAEDFTVVCHDPDFADPAAREAYASAHPVLQPATAREPQALVGEVLAAHGRLDVLVNNDVYPAIRARVEAAALDDLRASLESLVVAPFALTAAAVPVMKERGQGKIIFVTSGTALRGLSNYSMYCAARGSANALVVSLARELARHNIQVNAIAPNFVENPTYFSAKVLDDEQARAKILSQIPLGRLGKPGEAGALVAFLAGPGSDFITGRVLPLDGGWA